MAASFSHNSWDYREHRNYDVKKAHERYNSDFDAGLDPRFRGRFFAAQYKSLDKAGKWHVPLVQTYPM